MKVQLLSALREGDEYYAEALKSAEETVAGQ